MAVYAVNTRYTRTTNTTPYRLVFGQDETSAHHHLQEYLKHLNEGEDIFYIDDLKHLGLGDDEPAGEDNEDYDSDQAMYAALQRHEELDDDNDQDYTSTDNHNNEPMETDFAYGKSLFTLTTKDATSFNITFDRFYYFGRPRRSSRANAYTPTADDDHDTSSTPDPNHSFNASHTNNGDRKSYCILH